MGILSDPMLVSDHSIETLESLWVLHTEPIVLMRYGVLFLTLQQLPFLVTRESISVVPAVIEYQFVFNDCSVFCRSVAF